MSRIKVDRITNRAGTGDPLFPNGISVVGLTSLSNVIAGVATFSNVSIGGTLTYEDVTNIDSVGLITARSGVKVPAGGVDVTAGGVNVTAGGVNVTAGGVDVTAGGVTVTTGDIDVISGSIGIGTVTPANLLDIHGANGAGGLRLTETNHTNLNRFGRIFEYAGGLYFQSRNDTVNGDFIFRGGQDSVEKLRIGSSSQIGIGGANYGTSGQVLTSGGPSAAVQWATPSAGAWSQLTNGTFSSSDGTEKIITSTHLTSTHKFYKLSMYFTMSATNFETGLQVQSGGVWEESAYTYEFFGAKDGGSTDSSRGGQTRIHFGDDNWYGKVYNVECFFADVDTATRKIMKFSGATNNSTTGYTNKTTWTSMGSWDGAAAITGIRVKATKQISGSGTFDNGWYLLEGFAP